MFFSTQENSNGPNSFSFGHSVFRWEGIALLTPVHKSWYSKHPHIRTHDFGGQADRILI